MRCLLPHILAGCVLGAAAMPARAMNWEGHDDWMTAMEPALVYDALAPHARPRPPPLPPCAADGLPRRWDNPYEQIPLSGAQCRASPEKPETRR